MADNEANDTNQLVKQEGGESAAIAGNDEGGDDGSDSGTAWSGGVGGVAETKEEVLSLAPGSTKKRRRTVNADLYVEFTSETVPEARRNTHHRCRWCVAAYRSVERSNDASVAAGTSGRTPVPLPKVYECRKNVPRDMRRHLKSCLHFDAKRRQQVVHLLEEQTPRRKQRVTRDHDTKKFDDAVLEFLVDHELPFSIIDSDTFVRLLEAVRPGCRSAVPSAAKLKSNMLDAAAGRAKEEIKVTMHRALRVHRRLGLVLTGWKDTSGRLVCAVKVSTGGATTTPLPHSVVVVDDDGDGDGERDRVDDGMSKARVTESVMEAFRATENVVFSYVVSDDVGPLGRARRILRRRHPRVLWLLCCVRQIHLLVWHLLRAPRFARTACLALRAAAALDASVTKWVLYLRDEQVRAYGNRSVRPVIACAARRWNAMQACFASQLRSRMACKRLALMYRGVPGPMRLPRELECWADDEYWTDLAQAELLIRPLTDASFLLQREGDNDGAPNNLALVFLTYLHLYRHGVLHSHDASEMGALLTKLESRWNKEEHHLYFLSFCLHPAFRNVAVSFLEASTEKYGNWSRKKNPLCQARVGKAACFYYEKFELWEYHHKTSTAGEGTKMPSEEDMQDFLTALKKQLKQWLRHDGKLGADVRVPRDFSWTSDAIDFWLEQVEEYPEISSLAIFLLCAPVQSVSGRQAFADSVIATNATRNRFGRDRYHKMSQVQYRIRELRRHRHRHRGGTTHSKTNNDSPSSKDYIVSVEEFPLVVPQHHPQEDPFGRGGSSRKKAQRDDDEDADCSDRTDSGDGGPAEDHDQEEPGDLVSIMANLKVELQLSDDVKSDDDNLVLLSDDEDTILERGPQDRNKDDNADRDDDSIEEPPEKCEKELSALPERNDSSYPQENALYFRNKRYVRTDKLPLQRFVELANIKCPNNMAAAAAASVQGHLDGQHQQVLIEFPKLSEIYNPPKQQKQPSQPQRQQHLQQEGSNSLDVVGKIESV